MVLMATISPPTYIISLSLCNQSFQQNRIKHGLYVTLAKYTHITQNDDCKSIYFSGFVRQQFVLCFSTHSMQQCQSHTVINLKSGVDFCLTTKTSLNTCTYKYTDNVYLRHTFIREYILILSCEFCHKRQFNSNGHRIDVFVKFVFTLPDVHLWQRYVELDSLNVFTLRNSHSMRIHTDSTEQ